MHKLTVLAIAFALSLSYIEPASAIDKDCFKAYGTTPNEAIITASGILENADELVIPKLMKDNMHVRLLPDKEEERFVAVIYSTVGMCSGLNKLSKVIASK